MSKKKLITVVIEKTSTGLSAYANNFSGVATVGETFTELKENIEEVFNIQIEYLQETDSSIKVDDYEINYVIDLEQFFEYFSVINKSAFAEHYAKVNPSLFRQYTKGLTPLSSDKLNQISKGLHKLADEIKDLTFA